MILKDAATFQVLFIYLSVLVLENNYCGDQQWCSLTSNLNTPSAFMAVLVLLSWSWS